MRANELQRVTIMSKEPPRGFDKLRYLWYRMIGHSDTQARWQLRKSAKPAPPSRTLKHRHCERCQHLMLISDQICGRCGHTQLAPSWLLKFSKHVKIQAEAVVPLVVALCLFGYLVQIKMGGTLMGGMGGDYEVSRRILIVGGALPLSFKEYISAEHGWRLFTYTCLHGNLMHIGFNLVALFQVGPLVARTFGFSRTLFIWTVSGAGAILLPALIYPKSGLTIGASGSVFGLIGVAMVFGHRVGTPQGLFIRNKMIEWTVFCTLFGMMMGGVAHSAHFGGLISGGLLSYLITPPRSASDQARSLLLATPAVLFIGWSFWSAYQVYKVMALY